MSDAQEPKQETREKTAEELQELVAGWEQTLDAIENELEQKKEPEGNNEE